MKNRILSIRLRAALLAGTFLTSASLYSMQLTTVDDAYLDETESLSDEETEQVPTGSGVGAFFASQVSGARELLSYGRRAAEDQLSQINGSATPVYASSPPLVMQAEESACKLIEFFLNDAEKYAAFRKSLPTDMRGLLARYLLRKHPLVSLIRERLPSVLLLREFNSGRRNCTTEVCINRSGKRIITNASGCIKFWDSEAEQELRTWQAEDYCTFAQFQQSDEEIVTASSYGGVQLFQVWDPNSGQCTQKFRCGGKEFRGYNALKKRALVIVNKSAKVWDVATGNCICKLKDSESPVVLAKFDTSADRVVTVLTNGTAIVWDVFTGRSIQRIKSSYGDIRSVWFDDSGEKLVTASKAAEIWDLSTGSSQVIMLGTIVSAVFNKPGDKILMTAANKELICNEVIIWHAPTGQCVQTIHPGDTFTGKAALWDPSGNHIVTPFGRGVIKIWDAHSGVLLYTLNRCEVASWDIAFDECGEKMVVSFSDGIARLWDLKRLLALSTWLEKECTLEQALLSHCIYETLIAHALVKKHDPQACLLFDFNRCPHLQTYFDSMPVEIQSCLKPFVIKLAKQNRPLAVLEVPES